MHLADATTKATYNNYSNILIFCIMCVCVYISYYFLYMCVL